MSEKHWNGLSNHGLVLLTLASDPGIRVRDIAAKVGMTERNVQRLVQDLVSSGVVERTRQGRRNVYHLQRDQPLAHSLEAHRTVGDLLDTFLTPVRQEYAR